MDIYRVSAEEISTADLSGLTNTQLRYLGQRLDVLYGNIPDTLWVAALRHLATEYKKRYP